VGDPRGATGVGPPSLTCPSRGNLRPLHVYTRDLAPPREGRLTENVLARVPEGDQEIVAAAVRSIFAKSDPDALAARDDEVSDALGPRLPKAAELRRDATSDVRAFPQAPWRKTWSTTPLERLNKEIRRRSRVVGIFPNDAGAMHLIGAVRAGEHEWAVARRSLYEESVAEINRARDRRPSARDPDLRDRGSPSDSHHVPALYRRSCQSCGEPARASQDDLCSSGHLRVVRSRGARVAAATEKTCGPALHRTKPGYEGAPTHSYRACRLAVRQTEQRV